MHAQTFLIKSLVKMTSVFLIILILKKRNLFQVFNILRKSRVKFQKCIEFLHKFYRISDVFAECRSVSSLGMRIYHDIYDRNKVVIIKIRFFEVLHTYILFVCKIACKPSFSSKGKRTLNFRVVFRTQAWTTRTFNHVLAP